MNQRIHNLSKWRFVREGESMRYGLDKARVVIIDVNCPSEVAFYVAQERETVEQSPERVTEIAAGRLQVFGLEPADDDGRIISFVGLVKGRDRLEFAVDGAFDLIPEGGSAYVFSADGQEIATRVVAPVIFTRIANRRQRNPHLEMMEYKMKLNQQRLINQMEEESQRRIGALEARLERYAQQRDIRTPPELVGGLQGDGGEQGGIAENDGDAGAPSDESSAGESAAPKRRKSKAAEEL